MAKAFQVGKSNDLQPTDPWFDEEASAIEKAKEIHFATRLLDTWGVGEPVGVWDRDCEYIALWFDGRLFKAT